MSSKGTTVGHASGCNGGKCRGGCHKRARQVTIEIPNKPIGYYMERAAMQHVYLRAQGMSSPFVGQHSACGFRYKGAPSNLNGKKCPDCSPYVGATIMEFPLPPASQSKEEIQAFSIDKSQIGRKQPFGTTFAYGQSNQGKSAAMMNLVERMGATPESIQFDIGSYMNEKEKELAKRQGDYRLYESRIVTAAKAKLAEEESHRDHWETLGRLVGMAYTDSDTAFFALLEGFHRGRLNENQGRRAMGGPKQ